MGPELLFGLAALIPGMAAATCGAIAITGQTAAVNGRVWKRMWEDNRNWLASAVTGEQEEGPADTLDRFVSLLTWTSAPIKGYVIGLDRRNRLYGRMYLTCIPVLNPRDGEYYRNYTHVPKKGEAVNPTLKEEVEALRKLETYCRSTVSQSRDWNQRLDAYIKAYAGHLLLNYRALHHDGYGDFWKKQVPGALEPGETVKLMKEWEKVVARHQLLDDERRRLLYRAVEEEVTLDGLAVESLELAKQIAATPVAPVQERKSQEVEALPLTAEEQELVRQFRSRRDHLEATERMDGEVLVEKLTASARAVSVPSSDSSDALVSIASENRALAQGGLGSLMGQADKTERADTLKSLRADNLYLRQKSEEIGSRSAHA